MKFTLLLSIFLLSLAFAAINQEEPVVVSQQQPAFMNNFWKTVTKYYRFAKRKFNCFMWGKECHRPTTSKQPPPVQTPLDQQAPRWEEETTIESINWFEKSQKQHSPAPQAVPQLPPQQSKQPPVQQSKPPVQPQVVFNYPLINAPPLNTPTPK